MWPFETKIQREVRRAERDAASVAARVEEEARHERQATCAHDFRELMRDREYIPTVHQINPYCHEELGPKCREIKMVLYCPKCDLVKEPWK